VSQRLAEQERAVVRVLVRTQAVVAGRASEESLVRMAIAAQEGEGWAAVERGVLLRLENTLSDAYLMATVALERAPAKRYRVRFTATAQHSVEVNARDEGEAAEVAAETFDASDLSDWDVDIEDVEEA
jgi:hypothetical protein